MYVLDPALFHELIGLDPSPKLARLNGPHLIKDHASPRFECLKLVILGKQRAMLVDLSEAHVML